MSTKDRFVIATAVFVLLSTAMGHGAVPVQAQDPDSFGVGPGSVTVPDAVAGENYVTDVVLQNQLSEEVEVETETDGTVGSWTTLDTTDPFTVAAKTDQSVEVGIQVPEGTANGRYDGELRFTARAGELEDGSGYSIQHSVTVLLSVTVGAEGVASFQYLFIEAHDIELGDPPRIEVTVVNNGNIRAQAEIASTILSADGTQEMARSDQMFPLDPGEDGTFTMDYEGTQLALGSYIATAGSPADPRIVEDTFKVVPPGTLGKDLLMRGLVHLPRVQPGDVVKIEAPIVNIGDVPIGKARLTGEVYREDRLVGTFQSEARNLAIDQEIRLHAFFTPEEPGRYILVGVVNYDGFETTTQESLLTVDSTQTGPGAWVYGILIFVLILFIVFFILFRRRRKDRDEAGNRRPSSRGRARTPDRGRVTDR